MKKIFLLFIMVIVTISCFSQEYNISSAGQGKDGNYLVKVRTYVAKTQMAEDAVKQCAVHGVIFRGVTDPTGASSQKALVSDPNVANTKKAFFDAFFSEGAYLKYVSVVESSLSCTKVPKKKYEASALLLVDKESLQHYLEESGIIQGFSNLW